MGGFTDDQGKNWNLTDIENNGGGKSVRERVELALNMVSHAKAVIGSIPNKDVADSFNSALSALQKLKASLKP